MYKIQHFVVEKNPWRSTRKTAGEIWRRFVNSYNITVKNLAQLNVGMLCMYVCIVIIYGKNEDQPGKVANPARGQLNRENGFFLSSFAPEN